MKIFSANRKKLEPSRRFGGREFQGKVKAAQNYKRVFSGQQLSLMDKFWNLIGLRSKFWRWLGLVVVLVLFYFFVMSSQLALADIHVSGNTQVSTQQIQDVINQYSNSRVMLIKRGNFFLMTRGKMNQMLTDKIPNIKEISEFHKIWSNKLEITVKERTPGFAILSNSRYFLVDDEGVVVKSLDNPGDLLVVQDSVVEDFATGETLNNSKMAPFIISMSRSWPSKFSTNISMVKFPGRGSNEVEFTSSEGWRVFFDINRSASAELTNLTVIINKSVPANDRARLAYIDLRLSTRAYFCFKNSACVQQPQEDIPNAQ